MGPKINFIEAQIFKASLPPDLEMGPIKMVHTGIQKIESKFLVPR